MPPADNPIPPTMKAIQVTEFEKPYELSDSVPVPQPSDLGPFDLLVKIACASHCHTDNMVRSGVFGTKLPCTGSHEGAGTVVAIGGSGSGRDDSFGNHLDADLDDSGVGIGGGNASASADAGVGVGVSGSSGGDGGGDNHHPHHAFKVGDRVMCGLPFHPCGSCHDCVGPESRNRGQYCENISGHVGVHLSGNFAEYVVVDSRSTTPLPDEIRFQSAAPLACAGRTVWRGVTQCGLRPGSGEWLAIVGSGGGLGHLGVQFARKMGWNVIGLDARDEGLAMTRQHEQHHHVDNEDGNGSLVVIDARDGKESVVSQVHKVTGGQGADATLVLSDAPDAAALSAALTKMHGTMIQIAQPEHVSVPFEELIFRDIRIRGSLLCSADESAEMLRFVADHGIHVEVNLFDGLDKIQEVMKLVEGGKIKGKAVIVVDKSQVEEEKKLGAKY